MDDTVLPHELPIYTQPPGLGGHISTLLWVAAAVTLLVIVAVTLLAASRKKQGKHTAFTPALIALNVVAVIGFATSGAALLCSVFRPTTPPTPQEVVASAEQAVGPLPDRVKTPLAEGATVSVDSECYLRATHPRRGADIVLRFSDGCARPGASPELQDRASNPRSGAEIHMYN